MADEQVAHYRAIASVVAPRAEQTDIFRDVRNAICSAYAGHAFRSGANPELRMAHCEIKSQGMAADACYRAHLGKGAEPSDVMNTCAF